MYRKADPFRSVEVVLEARLGEVNELISNVTYFSLQ